ncbi:MAG: dUTP diphosphatase [Sediminibacterium sp.]|jgi:dUTP pyrophosphatase|nr:dUTP diphosphatase [Sediminibacterium sp.]
MSTAVQIVNKSHHPLPEYATTGSSGMDIRAFLTSPITMAPMERVLIPTGLFLALPENWEAQIRPRSGLAIKQGLTCLNTPGTIDADYRGELKVILINLSNEAQLISDGDRIAQMVFQKVEKVILEKVETLEATERGAGGFGHTGKK